VPTGTAGCAFAAPELVRVDLKSQAGPPYNAQ